MSAYTVTAHDRDGRDRLTVSSRFGDRYTYAEHDDGPLSAARCGVAELFDVSTDLRMVKLRDPNGGSGASWRPSGTARHSTIEAELWTVAGPLCAWRTLCPATRCAVPAVKRPVR